MYPLQTTEQTSNIVVGSRESVTEVAPTAENLGMVTLPYGSGSTPIATKEGMCRDSRSEPYQLPEEILVEIIRLAASNPRIDRYTGVLSDPTLLHSLTSYREVCKQWKAVIDGTTSLWAFLYIRDAPSFEALQKVIEKSGDSPLVISDGRGWMGPQRYVTMISSQMHRCKALWIKADSPSDLWPLHPLFAKPCPLLEELHFHTEHAWRVLIDGVDSGAGQDSRRYDHLDIWALRHNAGKLKTLSFGSVRSWGTGSTLSNLRELRLDWPRTFFPDLMEALAESPLLRTFVLVGSSVLYLAGERGLTVELGFLTRIEIRKVDASFAQMILSHINPPSLKQLFISTPAFTSPVFPLGDVAAGYQALFRSLSEAQGLVPVPIDVGMRVQELVLADNHTDRELVLLGDEDWPSRFPINFMQSVLNISRCWSSISTPPSLALLIGTTNPDRRDGKFEMTQEDLRPMMNLEGVTEIQVGKMVRSVQHLYEQLTSAVAWEDQPPRWLLPQLAFLVIEDQAEHDEALIKMLQDRYAAVGTDTAETVAPSPFSLVELVRRSEDVPRPDVLEAIRKIVGDEKFRIEIKPHV
ncbi:hypothetical protein FRC01_000184 [Tulasnella sp. 417]|nr:hypothetical protein FRC01_000184 [Tulasnella sp. 417]